MTCFRTCSTRRSRSQAPLCHCTRRLVSNQPEGTFARLRYILGGDRPSQTPHQPVSPSRDRKSTRLNSSHVSISYAVFCLKKKKITKTINTTSQHTIATNKNICYFSH